MSDPDLSSDFFIRLNEGSESAAEQLDRRYRRQLCDLVGREMGKRFAGREDPEDPVQSAFRSLHRGIMEKRFQIDDSVGLWSLLVKIVRRKILKHVEYHDAQKRAPGKETPAEAEWLPAREPRPEDAAHAADLIEQVLDGLEPPDPEVFFMRLGGCTRAEIAERVNCTEASVRIKLDRIRDRLRRLLVENGDR